MKYSIALKDSDYWDCGEQLLFLGEIENMKGHGVFMEHNGRIHHGWHIDSFFVYQGTHVGQYCLQDFLLASKDGDNIFFHLPTNLANLLVQLCESHTPEAAERSFVIQATKLVYG